jgi:hypothetical protein
MSTRSTSLRQRGGTVVLSFEFLVLSLALTDRCERSGFAEIAEIFLCGLRGQFFPFPQMAGQIQRNFEHDQ